MKFPLRFSHLTQPSGIRPRILIHGELMHTFNGDWHFSRLSDFSWNTSPTPFSRPLLFLASPYIHTFAHDTIHLSKAEMNIADNQLLGFSKSTNISLISFKLNPQKALTIHSHLTRKGSILLKSLQKKKILFSWFPAVSSLLTNIHRHTTFLSGSEGKLRIFLAEEMLQIEKQVEQIRFQHFNYLNQHRSFKEKCQTAEQILEKGEGKKAFSRITFSPSSTPEPATSETAANEILRPPPRSRDIKSAARVQKKGRISFHTLLKRNYILGLGVAMILVWAVLINMYVSDINRMRLDRAKTVSVLKQQSKRLMRIAETERQHARFSAIKTTIGQLRIQPDLYLAALDNILPGGVWVQSITVAADQIQLTLLDSKESEVSALIDNIGQQFGKTSLKSSEEIKLEKIPIHRFIIEINELKPLQ